MKKRYDMEAMLMLIFLMSFLMSLNEEEISKYMRESAELIRDVGSLFQECIDTLQGKEMDEKG